MPRFASAFLLALVALLAGPAAVGANPFTPSGGTVVADSGFRPSAHGYSFENYGNDIKPTNLTPVEMQDLFGRAVCARVAADGECATLTTAAREWMTSQNAGMDGGHCEGMAVTASFFYNGIQPPPGAFGSSSVPALPLTGNTFLQRYIAYGFVFQYLRSVERAKITGTPTQVLEATIDALRAREPVTIGFYMPDMSGGHAVTPIFVVDRGDGIFDLVIYDNNFPNQLRSIVVDTNEDTFNYQGGTNPANADETYEGNASTKTLELERILPGLGLQECPFCGRSAAAERRLPARRTWSRSSGTAMTGTAVTGT